MDIEYDAIINAGIAADPDTYELTTEEFKGWQTRIDEALKEYIANNEA